MHWSDLRPDAIVLIIYDNEGQKEKVRFRDSSPSKASKAAHTNTHTSNENCMLQPCCFSYLFLSKGMRVGNICWSGACGRRLCHRLLQRAAAKPPSRRVKSTDLFTDGLA